MAMKTFVRATMVALAALFATFHSAPAGAQLQRGMPTTPFSTSDFSKLHWLEGTWQGTSPGEATVVQRIRFTSDSTIDITYYADSTRGRETGTGRVYLSVGR